MVYMTLSVIIMFGSWLFVFINDVIIVSILIMLL